MQYLSQAWIDAADGAVSAAAASAPAGRLTIDQHIDGVVSYRVVIAPDDSSIKRLDGAGGAVADASFTQNEPTARAVATGETDAHQAFLLGHITFTGDVDVLIERRDAFAWLAEVLAPVMARTDFG